MGPQVVDFSKVSAASSNKQHYFVQNLLAQPIHIVLDIKSIPEFKHSKHTSQIIPAGSLRNSNTRLLLKMWSNCAKLKPLSLTLCCKLWGTELNSWTVILTVPFLTICYPWHWILNFRCQKFWSKIPVLVGAMAKFPIELMCREEKPISQNIDIVINGCQFKSFMIEASVVFVSMDLSTDECVFRFDSDNWESYVDQVKQQCV